MEGFALILGHLIGDYVFQDDWQARLKTARWPGPRPPWEVAAGPLDRDKFAAATCDRNRRMDEWKAAAHAARLGPWACALHCALYTLAVACTCFWFLPWWAYPVIALAHYPVDRFRLAHVWMTRVVNQKVFATGALAPWSVIAVDNVVHLAVLFALAMIGRYCG